MAQKSRISEFNVFVISQIFQIKAPLFIYWKEIMIKIIKSFLKLAIPEKLMIALQTFRLKTYFQDGLLTMHNADFMKDPRFARSYLLGKKTGSWGNYDIHWRAHVACWAADKASRLEGDFVECGVNRGGLSRTVIEFVDFRNLPKKLYLLDTFCGLSEKYISEKERTYGRKAGGYEECYESVKETFKEFNVEIIRGTIPDTLPQVKDIKVSYLSIDMNCAVPEIAAAEYFWDKLVSGAVIVLDDYGWVCHIEQKLAFDEFASRKNVQVLVLPTGQGLIFKP